MAFIKIDGQELEVKNGMTILEAAKTLNKEIPHYCYHPGFKIVASCRMCLVKVQGMPKLTPACSTRIGEMPPNRKTDGKYDMVITTNDAEVQGAQKTVLEFLLLNHPVDCPECDQAGECLLQDYTYKYGKDHSRYEFPKRVPPRKDLGPQMLLISTRCILCSRCVRFTDEISGTGELMVKRRGADAEIDVFPDQSLDNKLSMNTADICPVGALVTKDFLFKPRNWRYEKSRTVCPGCSVGCNIRVEYMEAKNKMFRIKPVENPEVNQWWMCDDGRLLYHRYEKLERLAYPAIRKDGKFQRSNWRSILRTVCQHLKAFKPEEVAFVGSGYATNEENYLLQHIARNGVGTQNIVINDNFYKEDDIVYKKFTIKGEKIPNYQGALDMLVDAEPLTKLLKRIEKGEIKALFYLGGSPDFMFTEKQVKIFKKLNYLVVEDIHKTPLSEIADVVLAGASGYEKEGTFTNYQHHVQRLRQVIMAPVSARPDAEILGQLSELYNLSNAQSVRKIFNDEITKTYPEYQKMEYTGLGNNGARKQVAVVSEELAG